MGEEAGTSPGGNLLHLLPPRQEGAESKDSVALGAEWDILYWIYKFSLILSMAVSLCVLQFPY